MTSIEELRAARRWERIHESFEIAKPGIDPWDPDLLDLHAPGATPGELHVIRFLLNLWDGTRDWKCGRFDALEALPVWGAGTPQQWAFLSWADRPWRPSHSGQRTFRPSKRENPFTS